jgi:hypothetical protein
MSMCGILALTVASQLFINVYPVFVNALAAADRATPGWRQLLLPLATIILAGLEPSSLVHHHAV